MNNIYNIKCKCGADIDKKDGNFAFRTNKTTEKLEEVFKIRCKSCLQGYYQLIPDDIEIKND